MANTQPSPGRSRTVILPSFAWTARWLMTWSYLAYFAVAYALADLLRGRNPARRYRGTPRRGMSFYHDVVDWIGGWPYEVASCDSVVRFYQDRGFEPVRVAPCGFRSGCNEFVFRRAGPPS